MTFPIALIAMGAIFWPVTLALALAAAALGIYLRGGWRVTCFLIAGVMLATLALGVSLLAQWASTPPP